MPSTVDRTDPLSFGGSDVTNLLISASLQTRRVWTNAYLDGLETVAEVQRGLVRDTPLEPLSVVLTGPTQVTRRIVETYLSTGERFLGATRTATDRAGEAGAEAVKRVGTVIEKTAKKQAEVLTEHVVEPIPGYESLNAEQVVARLQELPQSTLVKVKNYETAHQARTTVLDRVESLSGDEPVRGYDELTVADIQKLLSDGDPKLAERVREYERKHKVRNGVIEAAERQRNQS
jgi:hypothetical protein